MKLFLLISIALIANAIASSDSLGYIELEAKKINGKFYPVANKNLVTFKRPDHDKVFENLETKGNERAKVIEVKISNLNLGLSEGDIIYHVHLNDKSLSKYKIREYVNILLVHNPMIKDTLKTKYHWNEYYLILSDHPKEIASARDSAASSRDSNGFAFIGKEYDFSKAHFKRFSISPFTGEKLPPPSRSWENTKLEEVRYVSLLNNDLYFNNEVSILIPISSGKTIYGGWIDPKFYSNKQNYIELLVLNKNQYLIPLNTGPHKYKIDFLLLEPRKPQLIEGEFELGW